MIDGGGGGPSAADARKAAEEAARKAAEQAAKDEAVERAFFAAQAARPVAMARPVDTVETALPPTLYSRPPAPASPAADAWAEAFRVDGDGTLVPAPPPVRDDWYHDPDFNGPPHPSTAVQTTSDRNDARLLAQDLGGTQGDQNAFVRAYMALDEAGQSQLGNLLSDGKLLNVDSQGHTLVQNLGQMPGMTVPAAAQYTGKDILAQTVSHLNDPNTINQSGKNTCGAATVQYLLAKDQPAEYARVVSGLTGSSGQVQLQGGQNMDRVPDSVDRNDGTWMPDRPGQGRDDVERIVQAAFQDHGFDPRGVYSNKSDKFSMPVGQVLETAGGPALVNLALDAAQANQGIGEDKVNALYQDVLGQTARVVGDWGSLLAPLRYRDGKPEGLGFQDAMLNTGALMQAAAEPLLDQNVAQLVEDAVRSGKQVPVDLILSDPGQAKPDGSNPTYLPQSGGNHPEVIIDQGQMGYGDLMRSHQVLVTGFDADGTVHYRNPWGFEATMTKAEFESRLTDAIIPD